MRFALLTAIITVFSSCGRNIPVKPSVDACAIILEQNVAFCINNVTGRERDIPLSEMNKYVAFSPSDWGKIMSYVKKLEYRIKNRKIKTELKELQKWHSN